jgi:hypothetical protein
MPVPNPIDSFLADSQRTPASWADLPVRPEDHWIPPTGQQSPSTLDEQEMKDTLRRACFVFQRKQNALPTPADLLPVVEELTAFTEAFVRYLTLSDFPVEVVS